MKRAGDRNVEENALNLTPLGAGREVGRSCLLLEYKGLTVLLDCGVLPSFAGRDSLPYLDHVPPSSVDVVVITCVLRPNFPLCTA
jgi:cleavage and polyadenylation specificity factor subunit 3